MGVQTQLHGCEGPARGRFVLLLQRRRCEQRQTGDLQGLWPFAAAHLLARRPVSEQVCDCTCQLAPRVAQQCQRHFEGDWQPGQGQPLQRKGFRGQRSTDLQCRSGCAAQVLLPQRREIPGRDSFCPLRLLQSAGEGGRHGLDGRPLSGEHVAHGPELASAAQSGGQGRLHNPTDWYEEVVRNEQHV